MNLQSYDLGDYYCDNPHHALLHMVLDALHPSKGVALEFGVGDGASTRCIAQGMTVYGFDSFKGLPENWRPGFDKGMFAADYETVRDSLPHNVYLFPGLFADVLPKFHWDALPPIDLVHIDCDLYSSTKTVLEHLPWPKLIANKAILVFDEWWGYPEAEQHEQRAWKEFVENTGYNLQWSVLGHGVQQWGICLV